MRYLAQKKGLTKAADLIDEGLDDEDFGVKRALWKKRAAEGMDMAALSEARVDKKRMLLTRYDGFI